MKERPIIFNDAMVRAILDGRKTQTRRVMKPMSRRVGKEFTGWVLPEYRGDCPFGQPGDRLWVRECWQGPLLNDQQFESRYSLGDEKFRSPEFCAYRATDLLDAIDHDTGRDLGWRPSIHMPRWASRITLEITGVRVERLQDISEEDARAEGLQTVGRFYCGSETKTDVQAFPTAREAFSDLWQSIYGAESWQSNSWVWVVEFRRFEQ